MPGRSFLPSPRATNLLVAVGFVALGYALYVRYILIESSTVGIECDAGLAAARCGVRAVAMFLFKLQLLGIGALILAAVHLIRPNIFVFGGALALAALGLVLYNNGASALALALLIVSFARPADASTTPPASEGAPRTTGPASSRASR